ncbi:AAA family ATPase [Pseudonocardia xinjiangensis]|uniref:ATP-binding protein n=1 Tax=Pseudonocardia xinjiangensis TaxID=75289 RepID=A0ABX1RCN6_9PSEU|nr:ATP-binding protein [Pseudonocardia xinjiangensis]NMH78148.1 ATP-binding protein [Pseudonocardia xinjiangensis]
MSVLRSAELVGRDAEWQSGLAALAHLAQGQGGLLVLAGEAGIGKSRLAADLAERAAERGVAVLRGRAVPGGGAQAYRPLAGAASQALRHQAARPGRPS